MSAMHKRIAPLDRTRWMCKLLSFIFKATPQDSTDDWHAVSCSECLKFKEVLKIDDPDSP